MWHGKGNRLPILLVLDFMAACFCLALYSVAHEYYEFFIPHIVGFAESGFIFCFVTAWHLVGKAYFDEIKNIKRETREISTINNKTAESFMEPKVSFFFCNFQRIIPN